MEVRICAVWGLEPVRRGSETLRDLSFGLGPDEAISRRVAGAGWNLAHAVGLEPQLQLRPYGLHGRRDDRVLLLLQHVGHLLSQLGPELSELRGEPVAGRDLFIARRLFPLALRLQVRQIAVER